MDLRIRIHLRELQFMCARRIVREKVVLDPNTHLRRVWCSYCIQFLFFSDQKECLNHISSHSQTTLLKPIPPSYLKMREDHKKAMEVKRYPPKTITPVDSTISFYETKRWKYLRARAIRIYGKKCRKCALETQFVHVDHIKPRSLYPELQWNFNNLQVLCKRCNLEKSNLHDTNYEGNLELIDSVREKAGRN